MLLTFTEAGTHVAGLEARLEALVAMGRRAGGRHLSSRWLRLDFARPDYFTPPLCSYVKAQGEGRREREMRAPPLRPLAPRINNCSVIYGWMNVVGVTDG